MVAVSYCNYHKHDYYTNPRVPDCVVSPEEYAKRAVEVGDKIISSCAHGWQGRYIEHYELAQKYDLKCLVSAEAYWVKNRHEKDSTNCHIFIGAKNENGRRALNDVLSEAAITGFYMQPRLDEQLILSLPPKDMWVTTACVGYWKYEDVEDMTKKFFEHFRENFFLEVQYHNTEKQQRLNRRILDLSAALHIPIIMGCDSHYIAADDWQRDEFIKSKQMAYGDEEGWMMDYPTAEEAFERFVQQGILTKRQIREAMSNTEVFAEVEEYDCACFNKEIKMPVLFPELTQWERNEKYKGIVWEAWDEYKPSIPESEWPVYEKEIQTEIDVVLDTNHADYFLDDYMMVKRAKELGGNLTATGRGSAVSFITNKLLGFTDVDRIASSVKMYPERFMSATRINETKSLADIDLNWGETSIPIRAQKEVFGENHAYPMITYGTMKPKAAWKMFAKAQDIPFDVSNEVSSQITRYDNALKHAPEDEKDNIDILDYIDPKYHDIYTSSGSYRGVVVSSSIHPCSHLIYQGDIRREIGLFRSKENLVCIMDGKWAEDYKFLKNDLLKVSVWDLIDKVYKRLNMRRHTVRELLELTQSDATTWDIYKNGCTLGVNQCEQTGTMQRVMKYAPRNISELCAFIAAIRPGFKSMYSVFENRRPFAYDIKAIDNLIQTEEMPNSFMLYQEQAMAVLNYAGIPMTECYEIIKNIAKKRVEKVLRYKEKVLELLPAKLTQSGSASDEEAHALAQKVWTVIEDSSRYSFNASHAMCVALDSLYCAYLKSHYPLEFYETFLRVLEAKGDKDRMAATKREAQRFFKIKFPPFRFGQDNRQVAGQSDGKTIVNSIRAIKGFGTTIGTVLYNCSKVKHRDFTDVLLWLNARSIKAAKITPLIQIGYFEKFGNIPTLLKILDAFDYFKQGEAIQVSKAKDNPYVGALRKFATDTNKDGKELATYRITDCIALLHECEKQIRAEQLDDLPMRAKAKFQLDIMDDIMLASEIPEEKWTVYVKEMRPANRKRDGKQFGWHIIYVSIGSGKEGMATIFNKAFIDGTQPGSLLKTMPSWWSKHGPYFNLDKYVLLEA